MRKPVDRISVLDLLDAEISKLQEARHILGPERNGAGIGKRRLMSAAARNAISKAQKRRWALVKKRA